MKNQDRYKTAQERTKLFTEWWSSKGIGYAIVHNYIEDAFAWLDLEAEEEKPETIEDIVAEMRSNTSHSAADAFYGVADWKRLCDRILAAHNRVAEKCREVVE